MIFVLRNLVSCAGWGLLISAFFVCLLYWIPQLVRVHYRHSLLGFILLATGFFFFFFQSVMLVGAVKSRGYILSVKQYLQEIPYEQIPLEQINKKLMTGYPVLSYFMYSVMDKEKMADIQFRSSDEFIDYYAVSISRTIDNYIMKRIAWITGGLIFFAFFFMQEAKKRKKPVSAIRNNRRRMPD